MKLHISLLLILSLININIIYAQDDEEDVDWSSRLIKEVKLEHPVYKPIIAIGVGSLYHYGDIKNSSFSDPLVGNRALNLDIMRTMNPLYTFGFRFLYGNMSANDYQKNLNFKTTIMSFGINATYNFGHIKLFSDQDNKVINPFLTAGIEFLNYDTEGDMKTADGTFIYNWDDGTKRNVSQDDEFNSSSQRVARDRDYESSYVEINKTQKIEKRSASTMSIGIPIDLGLQFTVSQKVNVKLGYSHHFTFVDDIDDITKDSNGKDVFNRDRTGDKKKDNFGYTYISFALDLFSKTTEEQQLQFLDLGAGGIFDFWDVDGDFVMDIFDQCPFTPFGSLVDTVGCPFDDDEDKIPNYMDEEENTSKTAFYVDTVGKGIDEATMLAKLNDNNSIDQKPIYDYYPSLLDGTGLFRRFYIDIPEKFKFIDKDNDGFITLDEFLNLLDNFFDGDSDLTVDDLYELNEFFFIQ